MSSFFVPSQKSVNEIFQRDVSYVIPEYQRPYSWDCLGKSEKNNQINIMWDDLYSAFSSNDKEVYFFGSMVLIGSEGELEYTVIDGQQRLTSIALLFVAIKCFLDDKIKEVTDHGFSSDLKTIIASLEEVLYNKKTFGGLTKEKKVKIEKNAGFDYDAILLDVFSCNKVPSKKPSGITSEQNTIVERYYKNKNYFEERIQTCFVNSKGLFDYVEAERLNAFYEYLKNKVSIVSIRTPNFNIAYHIFEILNNRGLQLSNKDLLRNFIIKEFDALSKSSSRYDSIVPFEKWQALDDNYVLDNEFISRWVESYNASQQKYSAFNDLKAIYDEHYADKGLKKKIEIFYNDLSLALEFYTKIVNLDIQNLRLKQKIKVLLNAGNSRYSINFLLALFKFSKGEETADVLKMVNLYERWLWFCILHTRFSSGSVYKVISALNESKLKEATVLLEDFDGEDVNLILTNELNNNIYSNDVAKLLIAKYVWIIESETGEDVVKQELNYQEATLEHIYPQSPQSDTNWLSKDFIASGSVYPHKYKLGNMTLVTQRLNAAMRNYAFEQKQKKYAHTKLAITHDLSEMKKEDMSKSYLKKRHGIIVNKIIEDLELKRISKDA